MMNILFDEKICATCKRRCQYQFTFGSCRQYEYRIGDPLQWEEWNPERIAGEPGLSEVLVNAMQICACNIRDDEDLPRFEIRLEHDVIVELRPSPPEHEFPEEGYIIVRR
jgi:hypothetical protein